MVFQCSKYFPQYSSGFRVNITMKTNFPLFRDHDTKLFFALPVLMLHTQTSDGPLGNASLSSTNNWASETAKEFFFKKKIQWAKWIQWRTGCWYVFFSQFSVILQACESKWKLWIYFPKFTCEANFSEGWNIFLILLYRSETH